MGGQESAEPVVRRAARVVAVSAAGRVLLLRGADPARPTIPIWHAPGGGIEAGETPDEAAAREFLEETGRGVEIGPLVWDRELEFSFNHVRLRQSEDFFLAEVGAEFEPVSDGHGELERRYISGHGWFSPDELRALPDLVAPPDLPERLDDLLRDGPPETVVRLLGAVLP